MSEFLSNDAYTVTDEDYSLGDLPPEIDDSERRPRPTPDAPPVVDDKPFDTGFGKEKAQSAVSKRYERRIAGPIRAAARKLARKPSTEADAAAIMLAGPTLAREFGDACADNRTLRQAADFFSEVGSPTMQLATSVVMLTAQIARNHEEAIKPRRRRLLMRGGREIELPSIGFDFNHLGVFKDVVTNPPEALINTVNSDPDLVEWLRGE